MAYSGSYDTAVAERLCAEVAAGRSLLDVCKEDWAPAHGTIYNWQRRHPEFKVMLDEAKDARLDIWAEEIPTILDGPGLEVNLDQATGLYSISGEALGRSKLRVQGRQWFLTKLRREQYGDVSKQIVDANVNGNVTHGLDPALLDALKGKLR